MKTKRMLTALVITLLSVSRYGQRHPYSSIQSITDAL